VPYSSLLILQPLCTTPQFLSISIKGRRHRVCLIGPLDEFLLSCSEPGFILPQTHTFAPPRRQVLPVLLAEIENTLVGDAEFLLLIDQRFSVCSYISLFLPNPSICCTGGLDTLLYIAYIVR
jgi:hypothetical protein